MTGWACIESCDVFDRYVELREIPTSGWARGQERIRIGWAIAADGLTFWRWDKRRNAPAPVAPVAWRPLRVPYTISDAEPLAWRISREEAERRVIRFCKTARVQAHGRPMSPRSGLADMIAETIGGEGPDGDERPIPFEPTPFDVSDELTAGRWFAALKTPNRRPRHAWQLCYEQELIAVRASGDGAEWLSMADLARIIRRSETVVAGHYRSAINEIWRHANTLKWGRT